jgi:hypothetical protein
MRILHSDPTRPLDDKRTFHLTLSSSLVRQRSSMVSNDGSDMVLFYHTQEALTKATTSNYLSQTTHSVHSQLVVGLSRHLRLSSFGQSAWTVAACLGLRCQVNLRIATRNNAKNSPHPPHHPRLTPYDSCLLDVCLAEQQVLSTLRSQPRAVCTNCPGLRRLTPPEQRRL